jgi:hypothetical protein
LLKILQHPAADGLVLSAKGTRRVNLNEGGDRMRCRDYQTGDWAAIQELWDLTGLGKSLRGDSETVIQRTLAQGGRFLILEEASGGPMVGSVWLTQDGRRFNLHHLVALELVGLYLASAQNGGQPSTGPFHETHPPLLPALLPERPDHS